MPVSDTSHTSRILYERARTLTIFHVDNPNKQICGPYGTTPAGILTEMKRFLGPLSFPPSAPVFTYLESIPGDQQVTVVFRQVSDGGSPITNYLYSTDNGVTYTPFDPAVTTSPAVILYLSSDPTIRLASSEYYTIILKAVNAAGTSDASNSGEVHTYIEAPAPTSLSATAGNASVTIGFSQSSVPDMEPITNYEYSTDDGISFMAFSPAVVTSPVTISGLSNNTTYSVKLRAVNAAGTSTASASVSAPTFYSPQPPTSLSATPGDTQVTVAFTAGANGGTPITNYKYSTDNGVSFTACSPADAASPITITGLTNGMSYVIRLIAVNIAGESSASSSVSVTLASATPGAPTITSIVGGDKAIYILYTAGSAGGSAITNYQYSIDNGVTFTVLSPALISNPLIVSSSSLVNGTPYSVIIQAINTSGAGASSNMISVTPQVNTRRASNLIIELDAANASSYPGTGSTWTNLQSSGSYSGTLENGPTYLSDYGGILRFNGTDQVVTIADAAAIRATTTQYITAQVWSRVRSTVTGGNGIIGKQYWAPSYDGFSLSLNTNGSTYLKMNGASVDGTYSSSAGAFATETWTLFTAVICYNGRTSNPSYVYLNPFRVATGNNAETSIPSNTAPLQFPRGINDGSANFCPADIGQIFYYGANLSQEDIIRNYDATKSRYVAP